MKYIHIELNYDIQLPSQTRFGGLRQLIGRICIFLNNKKNHSVLNNFYYLISLDQSEIKIKQIKMGRCVSLEREIEDGDCVTGISVINKIFVHFPQLSIS